MEKKINTLLIEGKRQATFIRRYADNPEQDHNGSVTANSREIFIATLEQASEVCKKLDLIEDIHTGEMISLGEFAAKLKSENYWPKTKEANEKVFSVLEKVIKDKGIR